MIVAGVVLMSHNRLTTYIRSYIIPHKTSAKHAPTTYICGWELHIASYIASNRQHVASSTTRHSNSLSKYTIEPHQL